MQLSGLKHLILVDAKAPVTFFAYPGLKGTLVPDGCRVHELVGAAGDVRGSLDALVEAARRSRREARRSGAARARRGRKGSSPPTRRARRSARSFRRARSSRTSQITSGLTLASLTAGAPRHDVLTLTGGAIGQGLPVAVGAAVACPGPPGAGARGGRIGDVHDPVAVDDGARAARRHRRDLQQPLLRDPERRARRGRRRAAAEGAAHSSTSGTPTSISSRWVRASVSPRCGRAAARSSPPRSSGRSPSPGRT